MFYRVRTIQKVVVETSEKKIGSDRNKTSSSDQFWIPSFLPSLL